MKKGVDKLIMIKKLKLVALLLVLSIIPANTVFADEIERDTKQVTVEDVRASVKSELQNEIFTESINYNASATTEVIFDYTDDTEMLKKSLTEPVTIYKEVTKAYLDPYATQDGINSYASISFSTREIRTYYGNSITMELTIYANETTFNMDGQTKYCHAAQFALFSSSSSSSRSYVRTVNQHLQQNGPIVAGTGSWSNVDEYNYDSFGANTGVYSYVYSSAPNSYVYLGTGGASYMGVDAELLIQWQTGPGSTDGVYHSMNVSQGSGL